MKKVTLFAGICLIGLNSFAQSALDSIRLELEALKEDMRRQRLQSVMPELTFESYSGLGPAASKVYYAQKGLSIAGYGDIFVSQYFNQNKIAKGDVLRFVPYIGYKVSDKIIINSELEIEHAGIDNAFNKEPEVYTEFLYTDFLINKHVNLRSGLILLPISIMNEYHEPTVFNGVFRPEVEQNIIPTVWRDLGLMAYGDLWKGFAYKVSLTNGLRTEYVTDWIKNARQKGANVNFNQLATTVRINYQGIQGLIAGVAMYYGEGSAGGGGQTLTPVREKAQYAMYVTDLQYQAHRWNIKAMYVIGQADGDSAYRSVPGRSREVEGFYAQAGYNIWPWINKKTTDILLYPYVRYEQYNLHKKVFTGSENPAKWNAVLTTGLNFYPHPQIVFKADYTIRSKKVRTFEPGNNTQLNLGLGFIF